MATPDTSKLLVCLLSMRIILCFVFLFVVMVKYATSFECHHIFTIPFLFLIL